jgi:3-methyladenine DNA glycosylase/8-oxoguanine DNA glycosylase
MLEMMLDYRPPYDWASLADFYRARAIQGVEEVTPEFYRRTIQIDGKAGLLEVRPVAGEYRLALHVSPNLSEKLERIAARVGRMFDLGADPELIRRRLGQDPQLEPLLRAFPGLRVPGAWDGFEVAVRAVLGQQISVRAATTLAGRLVQAYGEPLTEPAADGEPEWLFPRAEVLAQASLAEIGMPDKRRETIRRLAAAAAEGRLDFSTAGSLEDFEAGLTRLPGIGPWTAAYIALRLSQPDAFPSGDLGLRRGAAGLGEALISEKQLLQRAEAWRPWRAYAVMYLWKQY